MAPLFALDAFSRAVTPPADRAKPGRTSGEAQSLDKPMSNPSRPINYWIRGVFRLSNGDEMTRTVQGLAMNTRRDAEVKRFVNYLADDGWLFPEGRAILVNLLGIGADDGGEIFLGRDEKSDARSDTQAIPFWIRGIFRLDDGQEITRTIRSETGATPDKSSLDAAIAQLVATLKSTGHDFPEGHGVMIELLGTMTG